MCIRESLYTVKKNRCIFRMLYGQPAAFHRYVGMEFIPEPDLMLRHFICKVPGTGSHILPQRHSQRCLLYTSVLKSASQCVTPYSSQRTSGLPYCLAALTTCLAVENSFWSARMSIPGIWKERYCRMASPMAKVCWNNVHSDKRWPVSAI